MRLDDAGPRTWLLATLAGWALLAWLLALAGMGRRTQVLESDPSLLKPLPQARASAAARLKPLVQYDQIGTRPLFTQDRRPKPFFLPGQSDSQDGAAAFDYVLTSVLIAPNLRMAILQPADGSESVRVKLGEVPESHPAWRLTALDVRRAVFEGPEGRREMELRVFDGQGGQPPTALAAPPRAGTATSAPIVAPGQPQPANAPAPPKPTATTRPATGNANAPATANTPPRPATPAETADDTPLTEQAQMEAIRKRIEARRAQLRQQQAAQPPAKTP